MLCPEVWRFTAPQSIYKEHKRNFQREEKDKNYLADFNYIHLVSLVLPNITHIPNEIQESLSIDCDYYKLENISLGDLLSKSFIENFIKTGELTALSINTKLDIDNSICITPKGILVLSLDKVSYQELGLEGTVSHFFAKKKDRYTIQLKLKELNKTQYERVKNNLSKHLQNFTLILSWQPPEKSICPSSIAKYLSDLGHKIFLCQPKIYTRNAENVTVPRLIINNDDNFSSYELFEWLGMFSIDADLTTGSYTNYVNTYECPEENVLCENVTYLEWTGFFTVHQIIDVFDKMKKYIQKLPSNVPWISMYVQAFSDAPVIWNLTENHFFTNSENGCAIFFKQDDNNLICSQMCTNKRHK